jgi:hypothetical protein
MPFRKGSIKTHLSCSSYSKNRFYYSSCLYYCLFLLYHRGGGVMIPCCCFLPVSASLASSDDGPARAIRRPFHRRSRKGPWMDEEPKNIGRDHESERDQHCSAHFRRSALLNDPVRHHPWYRTNLVASCVHSAGDETLFIAARMWSDNNDQGGKEQR